MSYGGKIGPTSLGSRSQGRGAHAGVLAAEQEKRRLESQRRMLEAEAEAAEAAIIADAASSCGDRMSQVNDVAPSMESREKDDAFLNSITGNNHEPDFDQNHGAPATAAQERVLDRPFPPRGGAAGSGFPRHYRELMGQIFEVFLRSGSSTVVSWASR